LADRVQNANEVQQLYYWCLKAYLLRHKNESHRTSFPGLLESAIKVSLT